MAETILNVLLVILIIAAVILVVLYFWEASFRSASLNSSNCWDAAAQTVSLLVIDKKKLKITQAGTSQNGGRSNSEIYEMDESACGKSKDRPQDHDIDRGCPGVLRLFR